jgi:hypothetical protein
LNTAIIITNQLATGTSFGARLDTGETVFIPAITCKHHDLKVGGQYDALLVHNNAHHRATAPWRALSFNIAQPAQEQRPADPLTAEELLDYLPREREFSLGEVVRLAWESPTEDDEAEIAGLLGELRDNGLLLERTTRTGPLTKVRYAFK